MKHIIIIFAFLSLNYIYSQDYLTDEVKEIESTQIHYRDEKNPHPIRRTKYNILVGYSKMITDFKTKEVILDIEGDILYLQFTGDIEIIEVNRIKQGEIWFYKENAYGRVYSIYYPESGNWVRLATPTYNKDIYFKPSN